MGLFGIGIGVITTVVGIVKDDEKLIKRGQRQMAIGTGTLIVGDVFGVSDTVDVVSSLTNSDGIT